MSNDIEYEEVERSDGKVKVTKDTSTFGGPNMWDLHVKDAEGQYRQVQWMSVTKAERFVDESLTRYSSTETVERLE